VRRAFGMAVVLILVGGAGCDNVDWGGVDINIVPPPPSAAGGPAPAAAEDGELRLPQGPVLYHVLFDGTRASMIPIGELDGDTLRGVGVPQNGAAYAHRFIAERLRSGAEFTLFRHGLRAGTFIVHEAEAITGGTCEGIPRATGPIELTSETEPAREFLAMDRLYAPTTPRRHDVSLAPDRRMQIVAPILAERLMRARQVQLPGNWQRAMAQVQPFPSGRTRDVSFAATFLVGDTLGPGDAGMTGVAHSIFFIAAPSQAQTGWDTAFVRFANYPQIGKQAPRVVDFLDWTRDGEPDLLLQVFGPNMYWYEAVSRTGGRWAPIYRDPCRRPLERAAPLPDPQPGAPATRPGGPPGSATPATPPPTP
jgi:hypothetical protein